MNRKYVCPVGYEGNNLLITDWSEQDYTGVDFYDLYEDLYYENMGKVCPMNGEKAWNIKCRHRR